MDIKEMAKAHLVNIQQEINKLVQNRETIDQEISRLQSYISEGVSVLEKESYKAECAEDQQEQ
jgi:hypothetical protein